MTDITTVLPLTTDVDSLPEPSPFYYLVGKKKKYVHKKTLFGRVIVPVEELPHLPESEGFLWADIPKVPADIIGQVLSFFRAIYDRQKSEAMVYLTYKDGTYRVFVPPQETSGGGVHAELDLTHISPGWAIAGTIHSHCNFSAFHSGTDTHDADGHDGLHMTIGDVAKDKPSFATMLSFNKVRWDLDLEDATDHDGVTAVQHPQWWENFVRPPKPVATPIGQSGGWRNSGAVIKTRGHGYPYAGGSWTRGWTTPFLTTAVKRARELDLLETDKLGIDRDDHEMLNGYLEYLQDQFDSLLNEFADLGIVIDLECSILGDKKDDTTTPKSEDLLPGERDWGLWS